jgi:hypothetical protein
MTYEQLYYPTDLFLKMTDHCPNNCNDGKYCFAENTPQKKTRIDESRLDDVFHQAKACGILNVVYVSCEPFTDTDSLLRITAKATKAGLKPRYLGTSGYSVGETYDKAVDTFERLKSAGFDMTMDDNDIGSGYNGVDVSADQFHPISPEFIANTLLAVIKVFGPSKYFGIRCTHPTDKYNDNSTKNQLIQLLMESGEVTHTDQKEHEMFFVDGSAIKVLHSNLDEIGNALGLPKDMFNRHQYALINLSMYKDLRQLIEHDREIILEPFHKLYLDPDGTTYPALSRLQCLSGGNAFEIGIEQTIKNINDNPLLPVLIRDGLRGLLIQIQAKAQRLPPLYATGTSIIGLDMLTDTGLMGGVARRIVKMDLDTELRNDLVPVLAGFRERMMKVTTHQH